MEKRHVIAADLHGNIELFRRILGHSGFVAGQDVLVVLGDAVDIGKGSWDVLHLIEELGGILLLGNHEFAHIIGQRLRFDDGGSAYDSGLDWGKGFPTWLLDRIEARTIGLAYAADGVLMTHAGLSQDAYDATLEAAGWPGESPSAETFAGLLNGLLPGLMRRPLYPDVSPYGFWVPGEYGWRLLGTGASLTPLWFRPGIDGVPFAGYTQVAGHTPPSAVKARNREWLAANGCHLIDPWDPEHYDKPGYVRYATIEGGRVSVITDWDGSE